MGELRCLEIFQELSTQALPYSLTVKRTHEGCFSPHKYTNSRTVWRNPIVSNAGLLGDADHPTNTAFW